MTAAVPAVGALTAVVTVKSVPVGGRHLRVVEGAMTRDEVTHGIDPIDEVGVEWAVRAREAGTVDHVTAVTMGPASAGDAVRRALAIGADHAVHAKDQDLRGSDVRTTAMVLAAAVRYAGARMAVLGYESLDGSSGAVPAAVAALLGWPLLTRVRDAKVDGSRIEAQVSTTGGTRAVEADLPAVCSVIEGAVAPRYPSLQDVLRARQREVVEVGLVDLGVELPVRSRRERVVRVDVIERPPVEPVIVGPDDGVEKVLGVLEGERLRDD